MDFPCSVCSGDRALSHAGCLRREFFIIPAIVSESILRILPYFFESQRAIVEFRQERIVAVQQSQDTIEYEHFPCILFNDFTAERCVRGAD